MPKTKKQNKTKKQRKQRKTRKVARPSKTLKGNMDKIYKYNAHPKTQYILSSNGVAGQINLAGGARPFTNDPSGSSFIAPLTAPTGFVNYYDFGAAVGFRLTDLNNYLALANLYDSYKINSVTLRFECLSNTSQTNSAGINPTMYAALDWDDNTVPTNLRDVQGRQAHKKFTFTSSKTQHSITIKPRVASFIYNPAIEGSVTVPVKAGYAQSKGWQDCTWPDNEYYGLKLWFSDVLMPGVPNINFGFRVTMTYNISFKTVIAAY